MFRTSTASASVVTHIRVHMPRLHFGMVHDAGILHEHVHRIPARSQTKFKH